MMAKKIIGALLLAASIVPANATISRLQALGMEEYDNEGSYYIDDERNVFLNAANVNSVGDKVILEWGNNGFDISGLALRTNTQVRTDETFSPKARGGFFKKAGNFSYGVYLGNESDVSSMLRIIATPEAQIAGGALDGADNQVDVFLGGSAGFADWGVNFAYAADDFENSATDKGEDTAYAIRLGLKNTQWETFVNMSLKGEAERTSAAGNIKFDGSFGIHVGGSYNLNNMGKAYASYKTFNWDQIDTASVTTEGEFNVIIAGYGMEKRAGAGTLFTNLEYRSTDVEVKFTTLPASTNNTTIPLTVGYEYEANSWLTLRGSVRHNLMGTRENENIDNTTIGTTTNLNRVAGAIAENLFGDDTGGRKVTLANKTDVRAGATLKFGNLKVDGLIGLGGNNGTIATSNGERGALDLDRLLARVGMVYSF